MRALFRVPPPEPRHDRFRSPGSPAAIPCVTHGGRPVPLRRSALRIPRGRRASGRLGSFALWTGLPSSLVGRCSHDYCGPSVAMGLAPGRRSRVRPCCTSERDVGVPLISLIALTGQRSTLRRLRRVRFDPVAGRGAGLRCRSGGPTVRSSGDWASGNPAFAISRGSLGAPPLTPGRGRRFAGRRLSLSLFRSG